MLVHTWDLARATGQDEILDAEEVHRFVAGMEPHDQAMRDSGHYGPRVPVPDDADEQTKAFAVELIKKSATTASARLQFCRLAFGAAGSAGASIDTGDAEASARLLAAVLPLRDPQPVENRSLATV